MKQHVYEVDVNWTSNDGEGTKTYNAYRRDHEIASPGKPSIQGSSGASFCGDARRYNPEELLVASLSACHMLWYLHLCAINRVIVLHYQDAASGTLEESDDGLGAVVRALLKPTVKIAGAENRAIAFALHREAHRRCFIANSVKFPVEIMPEIDY